MSLLFLFFPAGLFLNVWAPSGPTPTQKLLPVMFWMHGGSFTMGGTTVYSGDYMFEYRRDVVRATSHPPPAPSTPTFTSGFVNSRTLLGWWSIDSYDAGQCTPSVSSLELTASYLCHCTLTGVVLMNHHIPKGAGNHKLSVGSVGVARR